MPILWYGIGHNDRLEAGIVNARNRRTRENAVRQYGIHLYRGNRSCEQKFSFHFRHTHLGSARFDETIGGMDNGAACIGHIVDQYGNLILNITDEHHGGHLVGLLALLVYQRELHVQAIRYGGDTVWGMNGYQYIYIYKETGFSQR